MALSGENASGGPGVRFDKKSALILGGTILAVAVSVWVLAKATVLAPVSAGEASRRRTVIDAETNELLQEFPVADGTTIPWKNPKTGKNTLYPAEKCYWTKDGKAKLEPTYVLLREATGEKGPTVCPDCGKQVVFHNPMPPANLIREAARSAGKLKAEEEDTKKK